MAFGKSYGAKKYVIDKFLKNGSQFLYLRRYAKELDSVFNKDRFDPKDFFDDIRFNYSDHELIAKAKKFYCDGQVFGYGKRLTEAQDLKSGVFENIKTIIIDEYPVEKNRRYYLPQEGMILMSIFDSVIRNRSDVKIFILGNAVERP